MKILLGNGDIATEERILPPFKSISLRGIGSLRVRRGDQRIEISCDSNLLPSVATVVSGGALSIGFERLAWVLRTTRLDIAVTVPDLTGLRVSGSASAEVEAFSGELISLSISGSGSIVATLDYRHAGLEMSGSSSFAGVVAAAGFELRSSGSASAKLLGSAEHAAMRLSGSSSVAAKDFASAEADVEMRGSSRAELRADKILRARARGSSALRYWGEPQIASSVSGSGRLQGMGA